MKRIMNFLILSCCKATELIEKKSLIGLSWREGMQLRIHKSMCTACTAYEKQSRILDKILSKHIHNPKEETTPIIKNTDLKDRIISNL